MHIPQYHYSYILELKLDIQSALLANCKKKMTVGGVPNETVKSMSETPRGDERLPKVRRKLDYVPKESFQEPPLLQAVFTYISYGLLIIMGYISDFLRRFGLKSSGPGYTEALKKDVSRLRPPAGAN